MNAKKIIPALFLIFFSLSSFSNESENGTKEAAEKVKNNISCQPELFEKKKEVDVRISFKVNENGHASQLILNSESEKFKNYLTEQISKIKFENKGEEVKMIVRFKLL